MDMMSMMGGMQDQTQTPQQAPMMVNRNMPLNQDPQAGVTGVQDMLKLILALLLHNTQMTAQTGQQVQGQAQAPQAQAMMPQPQQAPQLGAPTPQQPPTMSQPNY
jgi:hypothetical protein